MVPLLFCKLWQNMSYMKGKVWCFALFWKRLERQRQHYTILQGLFPLSLAKKHVFSFLGTYSHFEMKEKLIDQLGFTSVLTASLFCDRQPRGSILQGLFLLVNTSFPLSRFNICSCYLLPKKWVNLGVTHPSTRLVLFSGVIPIIFRRPKISFLSCTK